MRLHILSAGAAQGVVTALARQHGVELQAQFGAVGAMREALHGGAPCEMVILTRALIDALQAEGRVHTRADLGSVRTGIAVRAGEPPVAIGTTAELRAALLAAGELYLPDPHKATAGIHVARMLDALGLRSALAARLRPFANGATAMRELARSSVQRALGCTQITEIRNTPGVTLVGPLPQEFELATVYTAAVLQPSGLAQEFLAALSGAGSRALRAAAGFEFEDSHARQ